MKWFDEEARRPTDNEVHMQQAIATIQPAIAVRPQPCDKKDAMLVKLRAARDILNEATTLQEVKVIADLSVAAEIFSKRQQLGEEIEMMARAVKLEAHRKLGQMLQKCPKHKGGNPDGSGPHQSLGSLGIGMGVAQLAYKLADLNEEEFVGIRDSQRSVTAYLQGEIIRSRRRSHVKNGHLLDFPLPGGESLRTQSWREIRKASEALYVHAETVMREARWLALVASELKNKDAMLQGQIDEARLQELWEMARTRASLRDLLRKKT